jgi:hypothetical protein
MYKLGSHLVLFLRGYNVTAPRPRRTKVRRVVLRQGLARVIRLNTARHRHSAWF